MTTFALEIALALETGMPMVPIDLLRVHEDTVSSGVAAGEHSIDELEGLGAEVWQDVDPLKYVDELRDEWERH